MEEKEIKAAIEAAVAEATKSLKAEIKGLKTDLSAAKKEIAGLKEATDKVSSSLAVNQPVKKLEIPTEPFDYEGKKYKFKVPQTVIAGVNYLAAEILADAELQKVVVEKGLGRIVVEVY